MHAGDRIHIGQIQRRARARIARLDILTVRLNPADSRRFATGLNDHRLAALKLSSNQRAVTIVPALPE